MEKIKYYKEELQNLKTTRDINVYLDMLNMFKKDYLYVLSVKGSRGSGNIKDDLIAKLNGLGFTQFNNYEDKMYVGIIYKGEVIFDLSGATFSDAVFFNGNVENNTLKVSSCAANNGNVAQIVINDIDHSLNEQGLNIVVYDCEKNELVDSSTYDSSLPKPTFFHSNLEHDKSWFNLHFYIPRKFQNIWRDKHKKSYFSNHSLEAKEINNGIILPIKIINDKKFGGVCDEHFNFVSGHDQFTFEAEFSEHYVHGSYEVNDNDLDLSDETVVFGGVLFNHPGHLILEYFAERMWWYLNHRDLNLKIIFIDMYMWKSTTNFIDEFMEAYKIPKDNYMILKKPTKFKKVIVPDPSECLYSYVEPYYFTREYSQCIKLVDRYIKPADYKKIYLTKTKTDCSNIVGEDYFINFFKEKGFTIITPEDYTISEKISFMLGADEVVTPIGTNSIYAAFCRPETRLTLLTRVYDYPGPEQAMVNEAANLNNVYIVNVSCQFLHKQFTWGLNLMCVTDDFIRYVKDIYNEDLDITFEESIKNNIFEYLKYSVTYYALPWNYNILKNQSMLTVMQNISDVFLEKDFDTSKLDLTTDKDVLETRVAQLTAELNDAKKRIEQLENSDIQIVLNAINEIRVQQNDFLSKVQVFVNNENELQAKINMLNAKNIILENEKLALEKMIETLQK